MLYPADFEKKIGFDAVRRLLAQQCLSTLGSHWASEMRFMSDFQAVKHSLSLTSEMLAMVKIMPLCQLKYA